MSESGSDIRSGIGARLRAGRERMGLTLLQAAEKLHVDPKVVESLEAERFDALGAPVFVKGHLKHYAELTGEQAPELLEIYNAATKPALPDLTRLPKASSDTKPGRLAVPSLMVLIGFVLIGVVWWVIKSMPHSTGPEGNATERAVRNESDIQVVPETLPPVPYPEQVPPATPVQGTGANQPGASPGAGDTASAGATTAAGAAGAGTDAPSLAAGTTAAPAANRPMEVKLRFAADSWVEIYDSKGERLFADVGTADSEHTVSGTPPFRVTFGNAPGVSLDVNGKPATVPASLVSKDSAQFTINRSGRIVRARPQADGG